MAGFEAFQACSYAPTASTDKLSSGPSRADVSYVDESCSWYMAAASPHQMLMLESPQHAQPWLVGPARTWQMEVNEQPQVTKSMYKQPMPAQRRCCAPKRRSAKPCNRSL